MLPGWRHRLVSGAAAALVSLLGCANPRAGFDQRRLELPEPSREIETDVVGKLATLENGVRLFVVQDPKSALIEFDVRHHVGARDDPPQLPGLAHLVEHLMFEVETEAGVPVMLDLPDSSLHFGGFTTADWTHYQHLGPPDSLERFVEYAQARLGFDCEALEDSVLEREVEVVRNELRYRRLGWLDAIYRAVYPQSHPYHAALGGDEASLARVTRQDVCDFVTRYYSPSTTDVVITGDVEPQRALELVKTRLGPLAPKPVQRRALPVLQTQARDRVVRAPVSGPATVLAYALPSEADRASIEVEVAWRTATLVLPRLLEDRKHRKAQSAQFFVVGGRDAPVLLVDVVPVAGEDPSKAAAEVRAVIDDIVSTPLPPEVYERSRQRIRRSVLSSVASTLESASAYADALSSEPSRFYGDDLHTLDAMNPQRLQEVGSRYLQASSAIRLSVVPDPASEEASEGARSLGRVDPGHAGWRAPVDPAEAQRDLPFVASSGDVKPTSFTLDNGLEVMLLQTTDFPLMEATMIVHAGLRDAEVSDVAAVVPHAFRPDFSAIETWQLARAFEASGSVFSIDAGANAISYQARGMSIYLDMVLAWFSERALNGVPTENLAFHYRDTKLDLVESGEAEALLGQARVADALWGVGHPNTLRSAVSRRELRRVTDRRLRLWYQEHLRADNATLVVTGGFDEALVRRYVRVYFGDRQFRRPDITRWNTPSPARARARIPEPRPGETRVFTEVVPGALQLQVEMSFPLAGTWGEARAGLLILVEMLDAEVQRLRREYGVAYSFDAFIDDEQPRIVVQGQVDGRRASEALPALFESLERLRRGDDLDRRFAAARRVVLHRAILRRDDPSAFSEAVVAALRAGVEVDTVMDLPRAVATARPGQVRALVGAIMPHGRSVTVLSGTSSAIEAAQDAVDFGPAAALAP